MITGGPNQVVKRTILPAPSPAQCGSAVRPLAACPSLPATGRADSVNPGKAGDELPNVAYLLVRHPQSCVQLFVGHYTDLRNDPNPNRSRQPCHPPPYKRCLFRVSLAKLRPTLCSLEGALQTHRATSYFAKSITWLSSLCDFRMKALPDLSGMRMRCSPVAAQNSSIARFAPSQDPPE